MRRIARTSLMSIPFNFLYSIGDFVSLLLGKIDKRFKVEWSDYVTKKNRERINLVIHSNNKNTVTFKVGTSNKVTDFRARSFSSKEPETLKWLEKYSDQKLLLDIGANIGIYSLYFAKLGGAVISVECSPLNFGELVRNVNLNGLQERIKVIPILLSDRQDVGNFLMGADDVGAAESSFENNIGFDGREINLKSSFSTVAMSLDTLLDLYPGLGCPNLIKLDVDGNEEQILLGATSTLSNINLVSVLCEANPEILERGLRIEKILSSYGFTLETNVEGNNQIWHR